MSLAIRPRRNRKNATIRSMVAENKLSASDLIAPLFVVEGTKVADPVASMPGQFRYSIDLLKEEIRALRDNGVNCIALFPVIEEKLKDSIATESINQNGLYLRAIREIKKSFNDLVVMADVAMDPYSSDGHDGVVRNGKIENDETLEILTKMAIAQANAGADIIGPSDMMDGRVGAIRKGLDQEGFGEVSIMSYTAKYASAFYGPFRDALDSAPKSGDKKTYQMDFNNVREALLEASLDSQEGADILMVKPGLSYLDVIARLRQESLLPIAAYNVSGEYAMVKAAAAKGWIDEDAVVMEMMSSFKRAGADIILTYFAKDVAAKL